MQYVGADGLTRWDPEGVPAIPTSGGIKTAKAVTRSGGGMILGVVESDYLETGARKMEFLTVHAYDQQGMQLWSTRLDSSVAQGALSLEPLLRVGGCILVHSSLGNHLVSEVDGAILDVAVPSEFIFAVSKTNELFGQRATGLDTTISGVIYKLVSISKYDQLLNTSWHSVVPIRTDGPYATFNKSPLIADRSGGVFSINSTTDDDDHLRTRLSHLNSSGVPDWQADGVLVDDFATGIAFEDGCGGVIILSNDYSRAVRVDLDGNLVWGQQPISLLDSPIDTYFDVSTGDNHGGAVVSFWVTDGTIHVQHSGRAGKIGVITGVVSYFDAMPEPLSLGRNFPNPFNSRSLIEFTIPEDASVELTVYSITGQLVAHLLRQEVMAGVHRVNIDAINFSSGVYLCVLEYRGRQLIRKFIVAR
jgi:hypothetical protein